MADHFGKIPENLVKMELNVLRKFNGVRCRNYCKYLENLISAFMLPVGLFLTLS